MGGQKHLLRVAIMGGYLDLKKILVTKLLYGLSEDLVLKEQNYHSKIISNSELYHFFKLLVNF